MALERELKTYAGKLPELVAHSGKFVLIKDDEIVAIFDTYADALKTGYDRFKLDTFLVKQIAPEEHVLQFSRDLMVECRYKARRRSLVSYFRRVVGWGRRVRRSPPTRVHVSAAFGYRPRR